MSGCTGLHCRGCAHAGGAGPGAVLLLVLVIIVVAVARPFMHAAASALHMAVEVTEIAALVVVSAAGLAALSGLVVVGVRARRRLQAPAADTLSVEHRTGQRGQSHLSPADTDAIPPGRPPAALPWPTVSGEVIARSDGTKPWMPGARKEAR